MRATSKTSKTLFKINPNATKRQRENSRVALPPATQAKGSTTTGKGGRPIGT